MSRVFETISDYSADMLTGVVLLVVLILAISAIDGPRRKRRRQKFPKNVG